MYKIFDRFFKHHPEEVKTCFGKLTFIDANPAMVALFEGNNKDDLIKGQTHFFNEDSFDGFREGLIAFAEGQTIFKCEGGGQTFTGKNLHLIITWAFPGEGAPGTKTMASFVDITERKQMEEALREREERLEMLLECAPDGYYLTDLEGTIVNGNKAAEQMCGYSREELIGKNILAENLIPPEEVPRAAAQIAEEATGITTGPTEFTLIRKDGSTVPIEVRATPVSVQGETLVLNIARDISDRKQAEEKLRTFKIASDWSIVGNAIINLDGTFRYVNESYARMHGYAVEELEGENASIAVAHGLEDEVDRLNRELMDHGFMENVEIPQRRKDGTAFPAIVNATLIKDSRGDPTFISFSMIDDTLRKKAEDTLRTFKTATDRSIVGNAMVDFDGTFRYVNETFARMHGFTIAEMEGNHARLVTADGYQDEVHRLNEELMRHGAMEYVELPQKKKDGSLFPAIINATFIEDEKRAPAFFWFSMIDDSRRKEAEGELKKFKTISDTSRAGNAICDLDGYVLYANEAIARMHGYETINEIMGKHFSMFHTEEQLKIVNRLNDELLERGTMSGLEVGNLRKDGSEFPSLINATLVKDSNDNPLFIALSSVDISDLKEKEDALRTFKTISDRANVGNAITDPEGVILYANDTLARMYGYETTELIGQQASIFHTDSQRSSATRRRRKLREEGSIENVEIENKRKDGTVFPALLNTTLIKDDNGEVVFASVSVVDISNIKQIEARLREREEELKINNLKLKEMNATLKVLLVNREEDKNHLEEKVLMNVKELSMPVLQKLRKCGLDGRQETYVDVLERSLNEIISPFMHTLASKYTGLTQAELEVANLVKEGKSISEIGRVMNLSKRSVETYRTRIRKKLGIGGTKVNLRTHLMSFR